MIISERRKVRDLWKAEKFDDHRLSNVSERTSMKDTICFVDLDKD